MFNARVLNELLSAAAANQQQKPTVRIIGSKATTRPPTRHVAVDLYEHNNSYVMMTDLPGYDKADIEVQIEDGVLSVAAERDTRRAAVSVFTAADSATSIPVPPMSAVSIDDIYVDSDGDEFATAEPETETEPGDASVKTTHAPASTPTAKYYHRERSSGKVARAFRLPKDADEDKAEVTYVDGVLTVTVPKVAKIGPIKLPIA